jgi:5,5'-dehydrodivanillate O-demethylase oxygenase subunit
MATTQEQNDRLTRIGPGTPMGNLLRRYWQPVAVAIELEQEPVRKVRFLGEDLTLYRSEAGEYGLITDRCPHRCMALEYGIPDPKGLRCAYHGWVFNAEGRCVEQPFEDRTFPEANYKDKIRITAYPVQELGGLLFAYFGPQPAPLLPRWDLLVRDDIDRSVEIHPLPCNWLQCMDNAADPVHFEYLHAVFGNYALKKMGRPPGMQAARHVKIAFDLFPYGIMKRRLLEGEPEDVDDWTTGHPLLFPNILAVGSEGSASLQFRVPIDDVNTLQFAYRTKKRQPGAQALPITVTYSQLFNADGKLIPDSIPKQDMIGWVAQGPISDRTREHLTASDKGVILFHKLLFDNMERVERGEDPLGTIRDPAENEPMVDIRRERKGLSGFEIKYGNYFERIRENAAISGTSR